MGWALPREWDRDEQDTGSAKAFLICLVPALHSPSCSICCFQVRCSAPPLAGCRLQFQMHGGLLKGCPLCSLDSISELQLSPSFVRDKEQ